METEWRINENNENKFSCLCYRIDAVCCLSFLIRQIGGLAAAPSILVYPGVCWKLTQTHISISGLELRGSQGLKVHGHTILAQWGQRGFHKVWHPVVLGWMPRVHGGIMQPRETQVRSQLVPKLRVTAGGQMQVQQSPTLKEKLV